jgi:hypothetical protein
MASIYDTFADSCTALAAKTKRKSDQLRLLQLAGQWRTVVADCQVPGKKPAAAVAPLAIRCLRARLARALCVERICRNQQSKRSKN